MEVKLTLAAASKRQSSARNIKKKFTDALHRSGKMKKIIRNTVRGLGPPPCRRHLLTRPGTHSSWRAFCLHTQKPRRRRTSLRATRRRSSTWRWRGRRPWQKRSTSLRTDTCMHPWCDPRNRRLTTRLAATSARPTDDRRCDCKAFAFAFSLGFACGILTDLWKRVQNRNFSLSPFFNLFLPQYVCTRNFMT